MSKPQIDFKYVVGGVSLFAGLVTIYFALKKDRREVKEEKREENNKVLEKQEKTKCLENL